MVRRTGPDAPKTIEDLCHAAGVGKDLAKAGILNGELPGYLVGSRWVIPAKALDDFEHGRWIPKPRPIFTHVPQPTDMIRSRKGAA